MSETNTRTMNLKVKLTDSERAIKLEKYLDKLDERDDADEKLAGLKAEHKAKVEGLDAEIGKLLATLRSGVEERPITCRAEMNYPAGKVEYVREDNGEVADWREMTTEEKQRSIPFEKKTNEVSAEPVAAPKRACEECGIVDGHRSECSKRGPNEPPVVDGGLVDEGQGAEHPSGESSADDMEPGKDYVGAAESAGVDLDAKDDAKADGDEKPKRARRGRSSVE